MGRANDLGGMEGFGPVRPDDDGEPFHADWEARVFGIHRALAAAGAYRVDELRDAIERMEPAAYLSASYYERWLAGITTLLSEKGLLPDDG